MSGSTGEHVLKNAFLHISFKKTAPVTLYFSLQTSMFKQNPSPYAKTHKYAYTHNHGRLSRFPALKSRGFSAENQKLPGFPVIFSGTGFAIFSMQLSNDLNFSAPVGPCINTYILEIVK
jgi:hypothetical protein